jgi:phosphate-selective porin
MAAWAFMAMMLFAAGPGVAEEEKKEQASKPGLELSNSGLRVSVSSCIHFDWLGFDEDEKAIAGVGSQENDFLARRVRLILRGEFDNGIGFYIQGGFEIPNTPFLDAVVMIPVGDDLELRFGQQKVPFSQERLRSWLAQPFIERSLAASLELRRSQGVNMVYIPGQGPLEAYLGWFTGETMNVPSTDDDFEYYGRLVFRPEKAFSSYPGQSVFGAAYSRGRRLPERSDTNSFSGKTMNGLTFFTGVPVNGYRTRYEFDADWRVGPLFFAGEYIHSEEQRTDVTVDVDTDGDGIADAAVTGDLDPLEEEGWYAAFVWVITGEDYNEFITPTSKYGALEFAFRYSIIEFDTQDDIPAGGGVYGVETSTASEALGRPSADETVTETYIGLNWILSRGVFVQFAYLIQDFDDSNLTPMGEEVHHDDVNYRARVGMVF